MGTFLKGAIIQGWCVSVPAKRVVSRHRMGAVKE